MSKKIDDMLYTSLRPELEEPAPELNRQILQEWSKEEKDMSHFNYKKKIAAVAIVCGVLAGGGATTYAAYRLLTPAQVAQNAIQDEKLMKAFESKDAIMVNETQSTNGYDVTLLGLASGNELKMYVPEDEKDRLDITHTYAAFAVAKSDGTDMEEQGFCMSPLINGVSFLDANMASLNGVSIYFVQDGILYQLVICDDLEMFADRGVQYGVVETFGEETSAFKMDENTGIYSKQESYEGISALFTVPFDKAKANPEKAQQYLEELQKEKELPSDADVNLDETAVLIGTITEDNMDEYYEMIPNATSTATLDADGNIEFGLISGEGESWEFGSSSLACFLPEGQDFAVNALETEGGNDAMANIICVVKKNEGGTYTLSIYKLKNNKNRDILY